MQVERIEYNSDLWNKTIYFAQNCSWSAGKHIANILQENRFSEWEAFFVATDNDKIVGFCSFLKNDYYPENRYFPWISSVFVDESARGKRVSHIMIETVIAYAKEKGFSKVYIPSDMDGFYEKCGFTPIDSLKNYGGDMDTIFMREI